VRQQLRKQGQLATSVATPGRVHRTPGPNVAGVAGGCQGLKLTQTWRSQYLCFACQQQAWR
jgi:hypothetical protein